MTTVETAASYFTAVARFRAEWPVTTNPFDIDGYDITAALVDQVDNQGEPCQLCAEYDAPVEVTVTGCSPTCLATVSTDCCIRCAVSAAAEMLWSEPVHVEVAR